MALRVTTGSAPVGEGSARQYVLFRVGAEEYGIPIERVRSIIRYEPATPVPRAPVAVEGVINLRGQVIPVVDLGRRLFGSTFEPTASSRIIVAESGGGSVGLVVDSATEVASVDVTCIMPAPETALTSDTAEAFQGVVEYDDRLVILLELDKALPRTEYEGAVADMPEAEDV